MLYGLLVFGFVFFVWALAGLNEAHSGVGRVLRELENERELMDAEKRQNTAA
jgi:hypothetical protein